MALEKDIKMMYPEKENYISVHPDPNIWKIHANYKIMEHYKSYIKGICGDLGCNHGACTLLMLEFNNCTELYGFDLNNEALEVAKKSAHKIQHDNIDIVFQNDYLDNIKIKDTYFDFLMSFHTIEHIYPENIDNVLKEFYRILKKDGYILISIPYEHAYPDKAHVAFYNEKTLTELFESNGFKTVECYKDDRFDQKNLLTGLFSK